MYKFHKRGYKSNERYDESIIRPIDIRQEIYRIFLGVARATFARRCTRVRIE